MLRLLEFAAFALVLGNVGFILLLAVRRLVLASRDGRRATLEVKLLPHALALVMDGTPPPKLGRGEQIVLAEVLGRLARQLRGNAREQIAAHFAGSVALRLQLAQLSSRKAWRRATAAYNLGDMAAFSSVPALLETLEDGSRDVRAAAARSLAAIGAVEAARPLIEQLVDGRLPRGVAGHALLALGTDIVPELHSLAVHPDGRIRATAFELLAHIGDAWDNGVVVRGLTDASADVRARAAAALGRVGTASSAAPLRAALDDRIGFVRAAAAHALGELRDREAIPRLLELARTDAFEVAHAAAGAAAAIDPAAVQVAAAEPDAGPHLHELADLAAL